MQKFICAGNLTKTPELRETPNGKKVTTLTVAVDRFGEGADFFNAIVWNAQAENCVKYLEKGSKVMIVGILQNRSYTDKEGIKRTITEIQTQEIEFLNFKKPETAKPKTTLIEINENDIPF